MGLGMVLRCSTVAEHPHCPGDQSTVTAAADAATSINDGVLAWCATDLDANEYPAKIQTADASNTAANLLPARICPTPLQRPMIL
jgi:hypothetical protein